jgi:endo-1,4-beta-D-glucanase Y
MRAGKMRYRVIMNNNGNASVSEGQGFGMMIVAMMAGHEAKAQEMLDGLFLYCKDYPSSINSKNMAWKVNADGSRGGDNAAFDGDADIIYGIAQRSPPPPLSPLRPHVAQLLAHHRLL